MILWIAIYRQIAAPFLIFPLFTEGLVGLGVNGVWWGLAVVNWSAAVFSFVYARGCIRRSRADLQARAVHATNPNDRAVDEALISDPVEFRPPVEP